MPYMMEVVKTGKVVEVRKTMARSVTPHMRRGRKIKATPERVERSNARIAERKLRRKLNTNFGPGDLFVTLTYGTHLEPPTEEEGRRDLDNFLRRLRREYKRQGRDMKYIAVTEYKAKRIHHHLVLNDIDSKVVAAVWEKGRPHEVRLDDTGDYGKLAAYLIKETSRSFLEDEDAEKQGKKGRRWRQSRNLKPYDKMIRKQVSAKEWRKDPKAYKGYALNKESVMVSEYLIGNTRIESQEYYMVEVPEDRRQRWKRLTSRDILMAAAI